jgi:hypothetical protein
MRPGEARVGMKVRLENGAKPMVVVAISNSGRADERLKCTYESYQSSAFYGTDRLKWRTCRDYVSLESETKDDISEVKSTKKEKVEMSKLYQTKEETPRFGTYLATNSQGKLVLEMKGTGNAEAFAQDAVEIVRPYTIVVKNDHGGGSYRTKPGLFEVGDVLILGSNIVFVVAVDTKQDGAQELPAGVRRLKSELVATGE